MELRIQQPQRQVSACRAPRTPCKRCSCGWRPTGALCTQCCGCCARCPLAYMMPPTCPSHPSHPSTPASSEINRYICDSPSEGGTSVSGGYLRLTANNDSSGGFVGARVDTAHYMSVVPGMAGTDGTAYNTIAVEMRTKFPPPGGWAGRLQAGGRGRACGRCLASRATGSPCMCGYSSWVQHALRAVLQARGCGRPGGCTLTR